MPTETLSRTAASPAEGGVIWQALQAPATWEGIPGVDEVSQPRHDPDGRLIGFDFTTSVGTRSYRGQATKSAGVDGHSLEWAVETPELEGSVAVVIAENGDHSDVTVTLTFTSKGMMSSMLFPMIASSIRGEFPDAVDRFARELGAS